MPKRALAKIPPIRPIVIGPYTLTATGCEVHGRPTMEQHEGVGAFIKRAHKASGWWLADWLRYGESRQDWAERLQQLVDATGMSEKTAKNARAIGAIEPSRRRDGVEFSLHGLVAAMEPDQQTYWLEEAEANGWTYRDLRASIHAAKRTRIIDGQAVLAGMYRVIYADPAWPYENRQGGGVGAASHYPAMTLDAMCKLPVGAHALKDSVLFLWVTAPLILQNPGPREVGEAWGFAYKNQFVWDKVDRNVGHYNNCNHEILTIWTRGSCLPDVATDLADSVQAVRKSRVHSEKPDEFRSIITKHWTRGPYLELFGRQRVEGWDVFGNDARLWAQEKVG